MGCLIELLLLPFKLIWELAEVIDHLYHHQRRRRPRRRVQRRSLAQIMVRKVRRRRAHRQTDVPDDMAQRLLDAVALARDANIDVRRRRAAYRVSLRTIDLIRTRATDAEVALLQRMERELLDEFRHLLDQR